MTLKELWAVTKELGEESDGKIVCEFDEADTDEFDVSDIPITLHEELQAARESALLHAQALDELKRDLARERGRVERLQKLNQKLVDAAKLDNDLGRRRIEGLEAQNKALRRRVRLLEASE